MKIYEKIIFFKKNKIVNMSACVEYYTNHSRLTPTGAIPPNTYYKLLTLFVMKLYVQTFIGLLLVALAIVGIIYAADYDKQTIALLSLACGTIAGVVLRDVHYSK